MSEENECKGFGLTREMLERCRESSLKPLPPIPVATIRVEPEDIDLVNRLGPTMGGAFYAAVAIMEQRAALKNGWSDIPIDEYVNRLTGKMDKGARE